MTYTDFIAILNRAPFNYNLALPESEEFWPQTYADGSNVGVYQPYPISEPKFALFLKWSVGGVRGRSCWGGTPEAYVSTDPEPAWTHLEDILEQFCPKITYLQFRRLERLVTIADDGYMDYYGNSTDYCVKILLLEDLWNFIYTTDVNRGRREGML